MNGVKCTFIKQDGTAQKYYFYFDGRKKEEFTYKGWVEEIYGTVTDFAIGSIKAPVFPEDRSTKNMDSV